MGNETKRIRMKRTLGVVGATSFIMGNMIGSGIFISPQGVLQGASSVGLSLLIWTLGGLVAMVGGICYIELGSMFGKTGGEYTYLKESYHPVLAYLFSAFNLFLIMPASLAAMSMTCSKYIIVAFYNGECIDPPDLSIKLIGAVIILTVGGINYYSVQAAVKLQIVFTFSKVFALVTIIIGGFMRIMQGYTDNLADAFEWYDKPATVGSIALGFYSSMWSFDGWNTANIIVEEVKKPAKTLPLAITIAIPSITIIYVLTNVSYFTVLSPSELLESPAVGISWARLVIPQCAWIVPLFVACSTFGSCISCVFSFSRSMFATAREGHMMKVLSYIHIVNYTPAPAVLLCCTFGLFYVVFSTVQTLMDSVIFTFWIFYCLCFVAVIKLRFKYPKIDRRVKVPIVFPWLAITISVFLVCAPILDGLQYAHLLTLGVCVVAMLIYVPFVHLKWYIPGIDSISRAIQIFLCVVPQEVEDN